MAKDCWDKAHILGQFLTGIAIPLGVGIGTAVYQDLAAAAAERRQRVQTGIDVLRD